MIDKEKILITEDDLKFILETNFSKVIDLAKYNSFCHTCETSIAEEMVNYKIYLNDLNDIIFEGECKRCKSRIARYVEIGEDKKYFTKTMAVKNRVK